MKSNTQAYQGQGQGQGRGQGQGQGQGRGRGWGQLRYEVRHTSISGIHGQLPICNQLRHFFLASGYLRVQFTHC